MKNGPETSLNLLLLEEDLEEVSGALRHMAPKPMLKVFGFLLPLLNCKNAYLIFQTNSPDSLKVRGSYSLRGKSRNRKTISVSCKCVQDPSIVT